MNKKIDDEIFRSLPRAYQIFYNICLEAGSIGCIMEEDDNDKVKTKIFNKKPKPVQKTLFLDNEA